MSTYVTPISPKQRIYVLHDDTAFNADAEVLKGLVIGIQDFDAILVWFTPDSYDGTAHFEISPDVEGDVWFPTAGINPASRSTQFATIATPTNSVCAIVPVPPYCHVRVRLVGGAAGSITVKARTINYEAVHA